MWRGQKKEKKILGRYIFIEPNLLLRSFFLYAVLPRTVRVANPTMRLVLYFLLKRRKERREETRTQRGRGTRASPVLVLDNVNFKILSRTRLILSLVHKTTERIWWRFDFLFFILLL